MSTHKSLEVLNKKFFGNGETRQNGAYENGQAGESPKKGGQNKVQAKEPGVLVIECEVHEGRDQYRWERKIDLHSGAVDDRQLGSEAPYDPPVDHRVDHKLPANQASLLRYLYWHRWSYISYDELGKHAFRSNKSKMQVQRIARGLRRSMGEKGTGTRIKCKQNVGYKFAPLPRGHDNGPDMVCRSWDEKNPIVIPDAPDPTKIHSSNGMSGTPQYEAPRYVPRCIIEGVSAALYKDGQVSDEMQRALRFWIDYLSPRNLEEVIWHYYIAKDRSAISDTDGWAFIEDMVPSHRFESLLNKAIEKWGVPADVWHQIEAKEGSAPGIPRCYDSYAKAKGYEPSTYEEAPDVVVRA